jgi:Kef-type K+ transport system membrane component KefB
MDPVAPRPTRTWFAYVAILVVALALLYWIEADGSALVANAPAGRARFGDGAGGGRVEPLPHVLVALLAILLASRLLGALFRRLHQPAVIGEVVAGIALGPSLLGRVAPDAYAWLLPPSVSPFLGLLAQVGVILFMFVIGLELDARRLRERSHTTIAISHASIVVPFLCGAALALYLYPRLATADVPFLAFSLFLGVSMSVTAFPVLARILGDRGWQGTRLGTIALTCAAVDDVTAWCLLAAVVGVVQANFDRALATVALTLVYVAVMLVVVRPLAVRWIARLDPREPGPGLLWLAGVALLSSALATEAIGVHAVFGAFLLGVIVPHDAPVVVELRRRVEGLVVTLFLPAFFAFTGMRTEIGLLHDAEHWCWCALILLVATAGKFGGSYAAARFTGMSPRDAASIGVLMNTRGLMELIVLNIGLDLHVLSPTLFAMMVIMAVLTTLATTPLLDLLHRRRLPAGSAVPPAPAR